jgi:predicted nucleic acid-binding protein
MAAIRQLVDTNVLVRFFTGEPPAMAAKAKQLIAHADRGDVILVLLPVIVAETFYTLESFYEVGRGEVATKMLAFLQARGIEAIEADRVTDALKRCQDEKAHFADAYLAAAAAETGNAIASFDRDFDKWKDVKRSEPKG